MDQTEPFCARCARHNKLTCCQQREIYTTPGDVRRIEAYTGLSGFYTYQAPTDPAYVEQDDDPLWAECVFRADGARRILRRVDGNCMFLGTKGCMLPVEVRPLVCRMYPYEYTEHGIRDELSHGCPVQLLQPGEDLLQVLDMRIEDARRWHGQLYEEIRLEKTFVDAETSHSYSAKAERQ